MNLTEIIIVLPIAHFLLYPLNYLVDFLIQQEEEKLQQFYQNWAQLGSILLSFIFQIYYLFRRYYQIEREYCLYEDEITVILDPGLIQEVDIQIENSNGESKPTDTLLIGQQEGEKKVTSQKYKISCTQREKIVQQLKYFSCCSDSKIDFYNFQIIWVSYLIFTIIEVCQYNSRYIIAKKYFGETNLFYLAFELVRFQFEFLTAQVKGSYYTDILILIISLAINLLCSIFSVSLYSDDNGSEYCAGIVIVLFSISNGALNIIPLKMYCKLSNGNIEIINLITYLYPLFYLIAFLNFFDSLVELWIYLILSIILLFFYLVFLVYQWCYKEKYKSQKNYDLQQKSEFLYQILLLTESKKQITKTEFNVYYNIFIFSKFQQQIRYEKAEGDAIGQGGNGQVFKYTDLLTEKPVAVKIVSTNKKSDLEKLNNEIDIHKELGGQPNIIKIHKFAKAIENDHTFQLFIVMDLAGKSLKDQIQEMIVKQQGRNSVAENNSQSNKFSAEDVKQFIITMVCTLSQLQGKNIIHRDIKPANILLNVSNDKEQKYYLADFGIAINQVSNYEQKQYPNGTGTLNYMDHYLKKLVLEYIEEYNSFQEKYSSVIAHEKCIHLKDFQKLLNQTDRHKNWHYTHLKLKIYEEYCIEKEQIIIINELQEQINKDQQQEINKKLISNFSGFHRKYSKLEINNYNELQKSFQTYEQYIPLQQKIDIIQIEKIISNQNTIKKMYQNNLGYKLDMFSLGVTALQMCELNQEQQNQEEEDKGEDEEKEQDASDTEIKNSQQFHRQMKIAKYYQKRINKIEDNDIKNVLKLMLHSNIAERKTFSQMLEWLKEKQFLK